MGVTPPQSLLLPCIPAPCTTHSPDQHPCGHHTCHPGWLLHLSRIWKDLRLFCPQQPSCIPSCWRAPGKAKPSVPASLRGERQSLCNSHCLVTAPGPQDGHRSSQRGSHPQQTPKLEISARQGCQRKTKHLDVLLARRQLREDPALALGTKE